MMWYQTPREENSVSECGHLPECPWRLTEMTSRDLATVICDLEKPLIESGGEDSPTECGGGLGDEKAETAHADTSEEFHRTEGMRDGVESWRRM